MDAVQAQEVALSDLRRRFERVATELRGSDTRVYLEDHVSRREGDSWLVAGMAHKTTFIYRGEKPWYVRRSRWTHVALFKEKLIFAYHIAEDGTIVDYDFNMAGSRLRM